MFTNETFREIFIVNKATREIHAASRLSKRWNLSPDGADGNFEVSTSEEPESSIKLFMFLSGCGLKYDFCGHCFPDLSKR